MNTPLDLDAIRGRLHHAYGLGLDESMARRYRADVPALVAEVERLLAERADIWDAGAAMGGRSWFYQTPNPYRFGTLSGSQTEGADHG